jgi:hypothetical protein
MKMLTVIATSLAMLATSVSAEAAVKKDRNEVLAQREAACKAQAAKRYSAVRFLARREYVNKCMGQTAKATKPKSKNVGKASP